MKIIVEELAVFMKKKQPSYRYPSFLFHNPFHVLLQNGSEVYVCYIENKNSIEGRVYVFLDKGEAKSPYKMAFGGFEFSEHLPYKQIDEWVEFLMDFCKKKLSKSLQITSYPFSYAPEQSHILTQIFLHKGFEIIQSEITHYLPITNNPFIEQLHPSEKRRLQKCKKANFRFELLENYQISEVHQFIQACRERKNFPMSMTLEALSQTIQAFPEQYLVFAVKDKDKIVALTVAIVINANILYNFYPADSPDCLSFSPTVMLIEGLYEFCQKENFTLLDLGISTDKGLANEGLIRFKKNLGAKSALKLSFLKTFHQG
jgi:hypothetical protein